MLRSRFNMLALAVILMGGVALTAPRGLGAQDGDTNIVCCPGAGGSCCGRECESKSDGTCEACSGFWSCLFM